MTDWNINKPPFDKKQDSLERVKPPSDEGGGKTKVLTEGEKEEKLKRCSKTSLPQPRWRSAAPSSEGAEKAKIKFSLHSWLPLSGELAPQATEG